MWLKRNGEEYEKKLINLDNVTYIDPSSGGFASTINFMDGEELYVTIPYEQLSKSIEKKYQPPYGKSEIITID